MAKIIFISSFIFLFFSPKGFAQAQTFRSDSIAYANAAISDKTIFLSTLERDSTQLVSLSDIAKFYSIRTYENPTIQKIELFCPRGVVKLNAGNPFITSREVSSRIQKISQLSTPAVWSGGKWFLQREELLSVVREFIDSTFFLPPKKFQIEPAVPIVPHITKIEVTNKKNGVLIRLHASAKVKEFSGSAQNGDWIYVTLPGAVGDSTVLDSLYAMGIVREVKSVQMETALQLSFRLRAKILSSDLSQDLTSDDLLFSLFMTETAPADTPVLAKEKPADAPKKNDDYQKKIEQQKKKWKLDVVVIDAGHGGHDPGTIGTIGTREKDVALGIALKLGELIEKQLPGVRVVYTRKTDRFVELFRRGQIANEAEGKLFISIHCNSTERKPSNANGFEIYLLRPGKTDDAIKIAEKENAVVKLEKDYEGRYQELTEENFIILTMAQSAYVKQSEQFAELLEETMNEKLPSKDRAVKQAGFYVLVGASMPNVLIETGYLSNPKEEKYLRNPSGQTVIAESIVEALKKYKAEYEKSF
ncbi:MAG: N-acetylmuramoyl-L-alanine amidase [Bacteroidetes bacterium]|nr:N-acetylmuramoyl-L-alanine amidase [Bacteroidota bacterium]